MGGRYAVERDGNLFWLEGDLFGDYRLGAEIDETGCEFVAPVQPSKIMAIGLNYKDHAAEMNKKLPDEPLVFLKPATRGHRSRRADRPSRRGPAASITKRRWRS